MKFRALCVFLLTLGLTCQVVRAVDDDESTPLDPSKAPPKIYMGPVLGYNKVLNSGGFVTFRSELDQCPKFQDGSGNGFYAGWSFEYLLGDPKNSKSSFIARILYNNMPSSFTETGDRLPSLVRKTDGSDTVIFTTTQHVAKLSYTTVDLDLVYRFNLGSTPLGINVGLSPGFAIKQDLVQEFQLIDPANAILVPPTDPKLYPPGGYSADKRTAIIQTGKLRNANALRIAVKAGVQYEILLRRMTLIPSVHYNFGVTNLDADDSWRVNAIQAGFELRFAI